MNKEFVPYEQALALKELGFDEQCSGWYSDRNIRIAGTNGCVVSKLLRNSEFIEDEEFVSAPLYQQAFRWFREKHELYHSIIPYRSTHDNYVDGTFHIEVRDSNGKDHSEYDDNEYYYDEAELACLNKLIEILKEKL